jgi:hypothetical protein
MKQRWHRNAMEDRLITIESADGRERVVICRRTDGNFTYRRQWADASVVTGRDFGWGALGPEAGIYDSRETAELEAMQRVPWLRANFH